MAPLTENRAIATRTGERRNFPLAAAAEVFEGSLVALNAAGEAVPMTTALNLKSVGWAERHCDNSAGAAGAKSVDVRTDIALFDNSAGGDAISKADIGDPCYGVDDQTVALTDGAGTRSAAGKIFDVDASGRVAVSFL